jgi:hypothetical protein
VKPISNKDPDSYAHTTERTPTLSLAVGTPKETGALDWPEEAETDTSDGQVIEGGILSLTETTKMQLD